MATKFRLRVMAIFVVYLLPTALAAQIRTVYVVPSSHWDRGFVTNPEKLLPRLKPHIDQVIDDAAADPDFRWTIESIWQLNEWLIRTQRPKAPCPAARPRQEGSDRNQRLLMGACTPSSWIRRN